MLITIGKQARFILMKWTRLQISCLRRKCCSRLWPNKTRSVQPGVVNKRPPTYMLKFSKGSFLIQYKLSLSFPLLDLSFSFEVKNKSMELLLAFEIIHDFRYCLVIPDTSPIISFYYFDSNLNSQIVGLKYRQAKNKQKAYQILALSAIEQWPFPNFTH